MTDHTRRRVLGAVGSGVVGATLFGTATASAGRWAVGSRTRAAFETARDLASEVTELQFHGDKAAVVGRFDEADIERLRSHSGVRYTERNGTMAAHRPRGGRGGQEDPFLGPDEALPQGTDRIDADVAIEEGETADGVSVAVLDTGIDATHPDLDVLGGKAFGSQFAGPCEDDETPDGSCDAEWDDDDGHGTWVAGQIAALNDDDGIVGAAPDVDLYAGKVLGSDGSGSFEAVANGIRWAGEQGFDVVNMSLGGGFSSLVADASEYAYAEGTLLVASAGNSGPAEDSVAGSPAGVSEVIAVGATTKDDAMAEFSSRGPEVELVAPGVDQTSLDNGGGTTGPALSGTSFSSPYVAAVGAHAVGTGLTNVEARAAIKDDAENLFYPSDWQGEGMVDAAATLGLDSSEDSIFSD